MLANKSCLIDRGIEFKSMKILQLILSAITATALIVIAVQLTKVTQPVINITAPEIPAPIIEEVIVQVDVPAPELQNVEVKVPAPVIETVEVNVPAPVFSGNITADIDSYGIERQLSNIVSSLGRISSALSDIDRSIFLK